MSLAVSPWTGNSHEVGRQFADDHLDLVMGGFDKDTCEDVMRHLCLNALSGLGIGCHHLGEMGSSARGRCLIGPDKSDDANEKNTGISVPVLGMCDNAGYGHAADNGNGSLNG